MPHSGDLGQDLPGFKEKIGGILFTGVGGQAVEAHVEGMGSMELRGRCERADLYVEGMSTLDAEGLQASHARLRSEGICHLKAYATESVDARAEGMGKIVCYGKPKQVSVAEEGLTRVKVK